MQLTANAARCDRLIRTIVAVVVAVTDKTFVDTAQVLDALELVGAAARRLTVVGLRYTAHVSGGSVTVLTHANRA